MTALSNCGDGTHTYGTCKKAGKCGDYKWSQFAGNCNPTGGSCKKCGIKCPSGYGECVLGDNSSSIKCPSDLLYNYSIGFCYKDTTQGNIGKCTLGTIGRSPAKCRPGWNEAHDNPGLNKPSGNNFNNDYNDAMGWFKNYCFQKDKNGNPNILTSSKCQKWCSTDSASCDSYKKIFCQDPKNIDLNICGCMNRANPSSKGYDIYSVLKGSITSGNDGCWWIPCTGDDFSPNFLTKEVVDGQKTCSDKTVCANVAINYNNSNLNYKDVKQYISCSNLNPKPDPKPEPDPTPDPDPKPDPTPDPDPSGKTFLQKYGKIIAIVGISVIVLVMIAFLVAMIFKQRTK